MNSTLAPKRTLTLLALLTLSTSSVVAADAANPCKRLVEACEAGGFVPGQGQAKAKGLPMDCMKKLMDGGTVEGVTVSADDVAACKAKKTKNPAKNKS